MRAARFTARGRPGRVAGSEGPAYSPLRRVAGSGGLGAPEFCGAGPVVGRVFRPVLCARLVSPRAGDRVVSPGLKTRPTAHRVISPGLVVWRRRNFGTR